jgi:hypothetical protein
MKYFLFEVKEVLQDIIIDYLLWVIRKVRPYKSEPLSWRLHSMADDYARRPINYWN